MKCIIEFEISIFVGFKNNGKQNAHKVRRFADEDDNKKKPSNNEVSLQKQKLRTELILIDVK